MLPELPDDDPDGELSQVDEPERWDGEVVEEGGALVPRLLLESDPGNWAVWQAGRGSLGVQSDGVWLDSPLLPDMDPDEDDPGELGVLPWFCTEFDELGLSLGDTLCAITGVASRAASAAAVSMRIMGISFSWRGRLGLTLGTGCRPRGSRAPPNDGRANTTARYGGLTNVKAHSWARLLS